MKEPVLWLRYSQENLNLWNFSGYPEDNSLTQLNFYPAFSINHANHLHMSTDKLLNSKRFTAMIVYEKSVEDSIAGLWTLKNGPLREIFVTNTMIVNNNRKTLYLLNTTDGTKVNTGTYVFNKKSLNISSNDTIMPGVAGENILTGKIGEFIIFDNALKNNERHRWQSYLCLKYGVTIEKGSYVNSQGDSLWRYSENIGFNKGVGGVGRDDYFEFNQHQARIDGDSVCIGINNIYSVQNQHESVLQDNEFLFWGHNGELCEDEELLYSIDTTEYVLWKKHWLVRSHLKEGRNLPFVLMISVPGQFTPENIRLFINRTNNFDYSSNDTEIYYPDDISGNKIWFKNIFWDTDNNGTDYFTFGYSYAEAEKILNKHAADRYPDDFSFPDGKTTYSVYPNPTKGDYELKINLEEKSSVYVRISDVSGRIISSYQFTGENQYILKNKIENQAFII